MHCVAVRERGKSPYTVMKCLPVMGIKKAATEQN